MAETRLADIANRETPATTDAPADRESGGPDRRCLVTRRRGPKATLLRFVVAPDGTLTPDIAAKLPGRGLYVWPRRDILEKAIAKSAFNRAAKGPVTVPDDLVGRIEALLTQRLIDQLALARRAGDAVAGLEKVKAWLTGGIACLLVQARDGSPDGRSKIAGLARAVEVPAMEGPTAAQLGAAFGRDHVVHAALRPGGLADSVAIEATRLAGLIGQAHGEHEAAKR